MMIKTKLFDPNFEKDNCGFGLIAQKDGIRSRSIVNNAIKGLTSMTHRGAIGSDKKTGDGCGLLFDLNHNFFKSILKNTSFKDFKIVFESATSQSFENKNEGHV